MRAALGCGAIALAGLLVLPGLRRSGARAGRPTERLETTERANDVRRRMPGRRLVALAIPTILPGGCSTVGSDGDELGACPPTAQYSARARASGELSSLPEGSAILEMLSDDAGMRDQVRAVDHWRDVSNGDVCSDRKRRSIRAGLAHSSLSLRAGERPGQLLVRKSRSRPPRLFPPIQQATLPRLSRWRRPESSS